MDGLWRTRKASADLSIFLPRLEKRSVSSILQWRTFILVNSDASVKVHALSFPFLNLSGCSFTIEQRLKLYRKTTASFSGWRLFYG